MGDDYAYGSPFADVDAQQQPIDEQLDRQLGFVQVLEQHPALGADVFMPL
jgi:hypothetical protein